MKQPRLSFIFLKRGLYRRGGKRTNTNYPHPADQLAFERAVAVRPIWNRFATVATALGIEKNVLLHAGPPFRSTEDICKPIMNSACVAAVYEGVADDFDQAKAMILAGEITLKPAQEYRVVTPLAAVVSASMQLHVVCDTRRGKTQAFAPINGGSGPSLRLGLESTAVLEHIRWLNGPFCDVLQSSLGKGIPLIPLAVAGLSAGDDCHGRTVMSTKALITTIENSMPRGIQDKLARAFMETSPSLFLNLWMAATKCIMVAASDIEGSSFVTAMAGNGVEAAIQISGLPGRWFTTSATPPLGCFEVDVPSGRALGAIGDSAVVEGFGLGAMAINLSLEQKKVLEKYLPKNNNERIKTLSMGPHPSFRNLDIRFGLTARSVVAFNAGPMIGLGILDKEGKKGRLGGGLYDMPPHPFADALAALDDQRAVK